MQAKFQTIKFVGCFVVMARCIYCVLCQRQQQHHQKSCFAASVAILCWSAKSCRSCNQRVMAMQHNVFGPQRNCKALSFLILWWGLAKACNATKLIKSSRGDSLYRGGCFALKIWRFLMHSAAWQWVASDALHLTSDEEALQLREEFHLNSV